MNLFRKFLTVVLGVCMTFTLSVTTFATELDDGPKSEPCDIILPYDPAQADSMVVGATKGAKVPNEYYNLDGRDYNVKGNFDTTIYTSYYFYPNADGEFWYNMTFTWETTRGVQGQATVECWDKTTGKMATQDIFKMSDNGDGTYGPTIETGGWHVYKLNPTHQYYFRFTKSFDGVHADVTGTISTAGWV